MVAEPFSLELKVSERVGLAASLRARGAEEAAELIVLPLRVRRS